MGTIIWIIIAVAAAIIGFVIANITSKKSATSAANRIVEDARRESEVIKEKKILEAKEEEMRILSDAEKVVNQKMQKVQTSEARAKQRELQLNQQQGDQARKKKELDTLKTNLDNREQVLNHREAEM